MSRGRALRVALVAAVLAALAGWDAAARAVEVAPPNVTVTLADVPLGEEPAPLALRFRLDGDRAGRLVWGEARRRADHRGTILSNEAEKDHLRLDVRLLVESVHSSKPHAFDEPGDVARLRLDLTRKGRTLEGRWSGTIGPAEAGGAVAGTIEPAQAPVAGLGPADLGEHPQLLIRPGDVKRLREKAATPWGQAMMARLAAEYPSRSNRAVGRGLLYVLTGDRAHADEARRLIEADIDAREWQPVGPVHDPAHTATEACIAYDLIHDACGADFHQRMAALLAETVRDLYWFANVVRPNGNDASNWSAMYRAGCGMAALAMASDGVPPAAPPPAPELARLGPPADVVAGEGVPVVKLEPGREWHEWLWSGPLKLARGQDGLAGIGGAAAARPEVGTKVTGQGTDGPFEATFEPVPVWLVTEETHQAAPWSYGSFMLGGLHGKSLCRREPFTTVYFYSVIENERPGWYRVDLVDYQLDGPSVFIAGRQLRRGDYLYLKKGRYPVLAWIPTLKFVPTNSHDRQNLCFRLRLNEAAEDEAEGWFARATAWHEALLGQWREDSAVAERGGVHPAAAFWLEAARQRVHGWCATAVGDRGWNSEGEAYNQHSYRLVLPFAHCYRAATGLDAAPGSSLPWVLPGYVMRTICRDDGAVMHSYTNGGGPLGVDSFARGFGLVPEPLRPATLWTWNRMQALADAGKLKSPWLTEDVLDPMSAAFMFVNYPLGTKEQDPGEALPRVMVDEHKGGYVFRNRWRDGDDLVATILLNRPQPGARNSLNTGCFRISGLGGDWAVRGAESADGAQSNRLFIPGHPMPGIVPAECVGFEGRPDGSGVIGMRMDEVYPGAKVRRWFAADYSGASGAPGLFVVSDRVEGASGEPVWQWVTGDMQVTTDDRGFTIDGGKGATLRATVVAPASPEIEVTEAEHRHEANYHDIHRGARFQRRVIKVIGGTRFVVVMTVQRGAPPEVASRQGARGLMIDVGSQTVQFDGDRPVLAAAEKE